MIKPKDIHILDKELEWVVRIDIYPYNKLFYLVLEEIYTTVYLTYSDKFSLIICKCFYLIYK